MSFRSNNSFIQPSEFHLMCLPGIRSHQLGFSVLLALLLIVALGANALLLLTIRLEESLHQPMYHLLSLLSLLDLVLCLTVIPKILAIFWFGWWSINFEGCLLQMLIMNSFLAMESSTFLVMAYDRYVAICHPLRYPSIVTDHFVAKAAIFIVARNLLLLAPVPILSAQLHYCGNTTIRNCFCANLSVSQLSCGNITLNKLYQFVVGWTLLGSDLILIILSYTFILHAVLRLKAVGAVAKALSTCGSYLILILFFSTILLVLVLTNVVKEKVHADIPVLFNVLHHIIPAALNPIVYGVRTKEIKEGIHRVLRKDLLQIGEPQAAFIMKLTLVPASDLPVLPTHFLPSMDSFRSLNPLTDGYFIVSLQDGLTIEVALEKNFRKVLHMTLLHYIAGAV
ncbi:olfactory receptor 56A4-like [Tachyglossus aculeatus]|uniref:olfactory receptor 56A4-like n=1 Tax=Tachyglossus aculeatus TaxID=9261 RepID=UPI0018F2CA11|nr:olfactory receptor 56A4-like [Tachyglossus aculeatus]